MRGLLLLAALAALTGATVTEGDRTQGALNEGDARSGEIWYQQSCAMCHRSAEKLKSRFKSGTVAEQAEWLDRFLLNHRAPNPDMRRDLIAFLLGT